MNQVINQDRYLKILLICLAVFIQQSTLVASFNASLSDVVLILLCIHIWRHYRKLMRGKSFILFFVLLICYRFCVTIGILFLDSYMTLTMKEILASVIKISVTFTYFILGYNLVKFKNEIPSFFKAYIISSSVIGWICILGSLTQQAFIVKYFFFDDIRAQGLMNDPNYFALTQMVALCLSVNLIKNNAWRALAVLTAVCAIFSSGSKTALIIMIIISVALFLIKFSNITIKSYLNIAVIAAVFIFFVFIFMNFKVINFEIFKQIPSVERMMTVFSGTSAIDDSGSNRLAVWENGLEIIKYTLGFGVGLFDYSHVGLTINHVGEVAHNTYIQIVGEWGIIFSGAFFCFIASILIRIFRTRPFEVFSCLFVSYLAIIIYSFTISLNNSRFVAIAIGLLTAYAALKDKVRGDADE